MTSKKGRDTVAEEKEPTKPGIRPQDLSADPATIQMIGRARELQIETIFDRAQALKPCPIGAQGSCCQNCGQGPCRLPLTEKGQAEADRRKGLCGASAETIAARNFARMIAAGAAAHSDHGRSVAETFLAAARHETPDFEVRDVKKLLEIAADYGVETSVPGPAGAALDRNLDEIALELAEKALAQWGQQTGELVTVKRAPAARQALWQKLGVVPRGIDREIVEMLHRTHMGVDQHYANILQQGTRTALADGWGGSMIATDLQDVLFGCPYPIKGSANLGVLKADQVNLVIHGHEPLLSEMIVQAAELPEMKDLAKQKGAKGIQLAGICCTANEVLARHGVPLAGNYLQQELAIITGAVEAMVVDVQCIMEQVARVAQCFHTKIITTNRRAKIASGQTLHIEFEEHKALECAKQIVKTAIENFPNRGREIMIPPHKADLIAGFSYEAINYHLGGTFRGSYAPLNENIINGRIRGVAGLVGCNNARTSHDARHLTIVKELLKRDVLVLTTGCSAIACAKAGLLTPEAARVYCGPGLAEICEVVGIPPVLHMGSCIDNSRILLAAVEMVKAGGLGLDLSDLPVVGSAPEWMSEKAISIGQYFVASGIYTVFGGTLPVKGAPVLEQYLFEGLETLYGARWDLEPDPILHARKLIAHIDKQRKALGLDKARPRVLKDMADRQKLTE